MAKRIKAILTKDELDIIKEHLGDTMIRMGDNGNTNTKEYKALDRLDDKLTRAFNKTGRYYLWQLKDRNGEVTEDNIEEKWR